MDFVAIDFETANEQRTSACSVGLAFVENNKVVKTLHRYIKPVPFDFNPFNVSIHGITEEDVINEPSFDVVWNELMPLLENKLIVAHNTSFDFSVLRRALEYYDIPCCNLDFLCTYKMSRAAFPALDHYRLNSLCKLLNIELIHHNAESDAVACAKLFCHIIESNHLNTLDDIKNVLNMSVGHLNCNGYLPCSSRSPKSPKHKKATLRAKDIISNISSDYIDDDFCDKYFVFTGALNSMQRSKAFEIVAAGGGVPQDGITKKTNYLVVGLQDFRRLNGTMSNKMKKTSQYRQAGQDIQILVEDEFIAMIDDELYYRCIHHMPKKPLDELAFNTLSSIFDKCGISDFNWHTENRSSSYLSYILNGEDFLRIKVSERTMWFSISAWDLSKETLEDIRFSKVNNKNQRH